MNMKCKLDLGAYEPIRGHKTDAGLDIRSKDKAKKIPANGSAVFKTGVHIQLPSHTCGLIVPKSGLNVKKEIVSSVGLIDEGYTGEIVVKLENHSDKDYTVKAGDKIAQMIIVPAYYFDLEFVEELEETERGDNGFGSTGR